MVERIAAAGLKLEWADSVYLGKLASLVYGEHEGMEAAAAFFDLPFDIALYLFDPLSYPWTILSITPKVVADRVRSVLARGAAVGNYKPPADSPVTGA